MADYYVTVEYYPVIVPGPDQVVYGGALFNCAENCCGTGKCVCCGSLANNNIPCMKCSCQGKIPSSTNNCFTSNQCCYYKKEGQCEGKCTSACNGDCTVNEVIYDTSATKSASVTCANAYSYISDPTAIGQIVNVAAVQTQCNSDTRLRCCQNDPTLGKDVCGPYWGDAGTGNCDQIAKDFCKTNVNSPLCACFTSTIPLPECTDKTCRTMNAMKTAAMVTNQCLGNYVTCQIFNNLTDAAKNNVITNLTINQICTQNNAGTTTKLSNGSTTNKSSTTTKDAIIWIVIATAVIIGLMVLGYGIKQMSDAKRNK
jgi:hypothetical protein